MQSKPTRFTVPSVLTLFGVTGDLVRTKILFALFDLFRAGRLPEKLQIYGLARRSWDDKELKNYLADLLKTRGKGTAEEIEKFLAPWHYVQGLFDEPTAFKRLAVELGRSDKEWRFCANKLFYLAVAPEHYKSVLKHLHSSGLTKPCSPEEGWTRVILEKPFGSDLKTAEELDAYLGKLFKEEQIYRVDHYLAKETVRNIVAFRFSNSFLTPGWNNKYIEKIECFFNEQVAVKTRGEFYDGVGALRDVGQSHLLQLLALLTMDHPGEFTGEAIRKARAKTLSQLEILGPKGVEQNTARAQYSTYKNEQGVSNNSNTETYFAIKATMHTGSFTGVPMYLYGGKALHETSTEVRVTFKHPTPCLCPPNEHLQNVLHYHISPDESMKIRFLVKKPGFEFALQREDFGFDYNDVYTKEVQIAPYEQLLMDIFKGDQTLFISTDEILAEWKFVEPIVKVWNTNKPEMISYEPGAKLDLKVLSDRETTMKKELGIVGLGKMGANFAKNIMGKGWHVAAFNRSPEKTVELARHGATPAFSHAELVSKLSHPRILWLMLPAGEVVDEIIFGKDGLVQYLEPGDIILDAGNSYYEDTIKRGKKLAKLKIHFADVGFSGGPGGARNGACFMVGGERKLFDRLYPLFLDGATVNGVQHFEGVGAGHFVKMVHNGIEYGMMQALGEGFGVLKKSKLKPDLLRATDIYNHGSVIESRLVGWLKQAYEMYGTELKPISGTVAQTGEGLWTVKEAEKLKVPIKVIKDSLQFRFDSAKKPSYTGQVVSALRNQFGGHAVKVEQRKKKKKK